MPYARAKPESNTGRFGIAARKMKNSRKRGQNMNFVSIKHNYERGLWGKQQVKLAVKKGVITPEQYQEITGEKYK